MKKKEIVEFASDKAKKALFHLMDVPSINAEHSLKDFYENTLPKLTSNKKEVRSSGIDEINTKGRSLMQMFEVDSHWNLAEIFDDRYRGMAVELTSQLIKEYECTTHAEKMLAEVVVNAYARLLDSSRRINNELAGPGTEITKNKTNYLFMLLKLHDQSNREFLNSLMSLKQIKAPNVELNIKTNTAFIAQNQQINAEAPTEQNI